MTFIETPRFPKHLDYGATGGPQYQTSVIVIESGHEQRNATWSIPRHRYDIASGIKIMEDIEELVAHFHVAQGRAHSFRFKDWLDYKTGDYQSDVSDTDVQIGTGDNAEVDFQLIKKYIRGAYSLNRPINKPVSGTVVVALDSTPQTETTHYTVDYTTGIVTFNSAPGTDVVVTAGFEFDVPVRFDVDQLDTNLDGYLVGSISIPLIEVKV